MDGQVAVGCRCRRGVGLGTIADQVSSVSQVAGSAASAGYSASALLKMFGPAIILGAVAVGCIA